MSGTRTELKRALFARVDGLAAVEVRSNGPMQAVIYVQPKDGVDFDVLAKRINGALRSFGVAGVGYPVKPYPPPPAPEQAPLSGRFSVATLDTQCTRPGLAESLAKLVPGLARVLIDEEPGKIIVRIAADVGQPLAPVLAQVRQALAAIVFEGLSHEIVPFVEGDRRGDVNALGILLPKRSVELNRSTEDEHEKFAARLKRLIGGQSDAVPLLDDFNGSRVVCTSALRDAAPLSCFLPLYDRVYAILPPKTGDDGDYFKEVFGLAEADFLAFCRRGKVVPVFKFPLGTYPESVVRIFLSDPSIPRMTGRDLDYVAARYAWQQASFARALRNDATTTRRLFEVGAGTERSRATGMDAKFVTAMLDNMLYIAENFEGILWNRGHLALGLLSPAMPITLGMAAFAPARVSDMAQIDTHTAGVHLAIAQAFGASLHTGLVVNEPVLDFVSNFFLPSVARIDGASQRQMTGILTGLDIAYNDSIPADRYSEIFDGAETRRMRQLLGEIVGQGSDKIKDEEIRGRLRLYNEGVRKIAGNSLDQPNAESEADVLGDIARTTGYATGHVLLWEAIAKFLDLPLVKRATEITLHKVIEDTSAGGVVDCLRGAVNQVPPQSVRLFRLRRKLRRI